MANITLTNQTNSPITIGTALFGVNVPTSADLAGTDLAIAEVYRDSGLASLISTPAITGIPQVGETLTGNGGVWQISANGTTGWADIPGASGDTYVPVEADATKFIRLAVGTVYSPVVGPVEAAE